MADFKKKSLIFADSDNGGIIHIANIKGGVGKSTVATNLAAALSRQGPTLIIDLDVQGSATVALGQEIDPAGGNSWDLFRNRFSLPNESNSLLKNISSRIQKIAPGIPALKSPGKTLSSFIAKVHPGLDLIAAGPDLFKSPSHFQLENLTYNLKVLRDSYKYIVLDTPAVWNPLTKHLYLHSDLNLIPVTLNALSTRSLRDYLTSVMALARHNPALRVRIIKNEVFGRQSSKIKGKTRTTSENRKFLDNLCEQVSFESSAGVSLLPQNLIFDLEIPESAIVRDAQDEGVPLNQFHQYSTITKSFEELVKRVQYVLNTPLSRKNRFESGRLAFVPGALAAAVLMAIFSLNQPISELNAPRPLAPQQFAAPEGGVFSHSFKNGESIYKIAKYAICRFRAMVPSFADVNQYILETVAIHNLTRQENEPRIDNIHAIDRDVTITFYPPEKIKNPQEKQLVPVYKYFMDLIEDKYVYVTGDWCERGTGGGQPHYGMDIAGKSGSVVYSPIDGEAVVKTNATAGRTIGVVADGTVIFFSHLDKRFLKTGDKVRKGQALGTIGMTGRTSGPHVHIGYGIRSQTNNDVSFGKYNYRLTDPKLFFYRQMYLNRMSGRDS